MCPMCWATLLATFSLSIAGSAVIIAGRDVFVLTLTALLLALAGIRHMELALVPWWCSATIAAILIARIVWIVWRRRDNLLVIAAWRRAAAFAKRQCP